MQAESPKRSFAGMFQIRSEQIEAFERDQFERLVDRLCAFLRAQFPDAERAPAAEIRVGLERMLPRASDYGLENEQELAIFAVSAWLMGLDFDATHPEAQAVLISQRTSAEKAEWLASYTRRIFERA